MLPNIVSRLSAFALMLVWLVSLLGCQRHERPTVTIPPRDVAAEHDPEQQKNARDQVEPLYDGKPVSHWRHELEWSFGLLDIKPEISLGRNGDPNAIPVLLKLLADPSPMIRYKAAACLGYLGTNGKSAVPALVAALSDPVDKVRVYTATALGNIGSQAKEAKQALIAA